MTATTKPTVTDGLIVINEIYPLCINEDTEIWTIDCRSKYAAAYAEVMTDDGADWKGRVRLTSVKDTTLFAREGASTATVVEFGGRHPGEHWVTLLDYGRYTVTVALYRTTPEGNIPNNSDLVWAVTDSEGTI